MDRLLSGVIDADPIVLGATVALVVVLCVAWTVRRLAGTRR
jgi:hypothetical protein